MNELKEEKKEGRKEGRKEGWMMKDGRRKEDAMDEKKMNKNERKRRKVSIGWHQVEIVFQNSIFVNAFIVYCHGSFDSSNSIAPCRSVCVIERFPEVNHRSIKSGRVSFPLSGMDPFICSSSKLMTVWSGANLSSWIHKPTRYDTRKEGFFCMI